MKNCWSKLARRLNAWKTLRDPRDAFLFVRIFCFAAGVPALLRLKIRRLPMLLTPRRAPAAPDLARVEKMAAYVALAQQTGTPLVRSGCLVRGVTLYYFLRRAGLNVALCFGMGEVDGDFVGHCWLVKDGEPFLESRDPRLLFAPMFDIADARTIPAVWTQAAGRS